MEEKHKGSDQEIETIVDAMVLIGDHDRDVYRSLAVKYRHDFEGKRERLETLVGEAALSLGEPGRGSPAGRRAAVEKLADAWKVLGKMWPLAAKLGVGGNEAYKEELRGYSATLEALDARTKPGCGTAAVIALMFLPPLLGWVTHRLG
jgi:hypothetical protein